MKAKVILAKMIMLLINCLMGLIALVAIFCAITGLFIMISTMWKAFVVMFVFCLVLALVVYGLFRVFTWAEQTCKKEESMKLLAKASDSMDRKT